MTIFRTPHRPAGAIHEDVDHTARQTNEPPSTPRTLSLRGVHVRYDDGFEAVHGVDLDVAPGEIVVLLGASGSGKSSLLRGIAGLEAVKQGSVNVGGVDVTRMPTFKRGIGMVFQDGQLFPYRNVGGNIAYGIAHMRRPQRQERVNALLRLIDLPGYADRDVSTLSGGQAQRVALARSLAPNPPVLLLDEPLSALDAILREDLSLQLRRIVTSAGVAAVYVTHDQAEAFRVADRVGIMHEGMIIDIGTRSELVNSAHSIVRQFLRAANPDDASVS